MAETEEQKAPTKGWRYSFGVFARLLTVPLILAVGVSAFLLARSLYASSLAMSENLGQVFAFFALFGAIGFFTKLGLSQLNKHLVALLGDLWMSMATENGALLAIENGTLLRRATGC
ncbi:MAG: hypothetical protein OXQ86_08820 [Gammaproteobacteria bacterium]|nr:hypothetical protein [Gammaproteobacteria bacterium]MDE0414039.1 hypothetical protein [Gammaproteobacteria bacterium]